MLCDELVNLSNPKGKCLRGLWFPPSRAAPNKKGELMRDASLLTYLLQIIHRLYKVNISI